MENEKRGEREGGRARRGNKSFQKLFTRMRVLPAWMSGRPVGGWCLQKPREELDPLNLELLMVVSCCVGTGN